jgi:hypothetical protein
MDKNVALKIPSIEESIKDAIEESTLPSWMQLHPENKLELRQCRQEMSAAQVAAMRDLAIAASEQVQTIPRPPIQKYHRKTGRIRIPREHSDSGRSTSVAYTHAEGWCRIYLLRRRHGSRRSARSRIPQSAWISAEARIIQASVLAFIVHCRITGSHRSLDQDVDGQVRD